MSKLEIRGVSVRYAGSNGRDDLSALDDINLTIEGQEFVVVVGPSGCGKTTLISLLAGFIPPTEGRILLDGRPVKGPSKDRGVVFQKHALLPWLSVIENAEFGLRLRGVPRRQRRSVASRHLKFLGLEDFHDHAIYQLSGGMQQRLGLARLLTSDPEILLMDEPFAALDAFTRENMQELILDVWSATGKMIFFVTHSVEEALFLATKLIVLSPRPGRIDHVFELGFNRDYLATRDSRAIRSRADYIAQREEVLALVRRLQSRGLEA